MDVFCVTMWSVCSFLEIGRNFFTVGLLLTLPLFSIHTLRVTGSKDLHPVTISCYPYSSSDYLFLALFFSPEYIWIFSYPEPWRASIICIANEKWGQIYEKVFVYMSIASFLMDIDLLMNLNGAFTYIFQTDVFNW